MNDVLHISSSFLTHTPPYAYFHLSKSIQYVGVAGIHKDVMELGGSLPLLEAGENGEDEDL